MPSLRDLLLKSNEQANLSGRALAALAEKGGHKITHATINSILAGTYKSTPSPETVRAIAWLAGVREEIAFAAAGQPTPGPPLANELPPGVDNLSGPSRKVLIELARRLIDLERKGSGGNEDSTASMNQAGLSPADWREAERGSSPAEAQRDAAMEMAAPSRLRQKGSATAEPKKT